MEALNVVGLKPISVLSKPIKYSPIPTNSSLKPSKLNNAQQNISTSFHGGLVLLSSVFNADHLIFLHTLPFPFLHFFSQNPFFSIFIKTKQSFPSTLHTSYEEALQQLVSSPAASDSSDFDIGGVLDGIVNFGADNPIILAGGIAVVAVPLIVSQFLKKPEPWGVETAKNAFNKLADDGTAQLLDIRAPVEFKQVGSPDIKGLKKKTVAVAYKGDDKPGFLKKLELKFKEPENTTLFILDKFDGNSELVAELVTVNGFKAAYAIKDGAEGPRGWVSSGLPWQAPKKSLSFDLSGFSDAINGAVEGSEAVSVIIGLAAATGLGLLVFTEIETILQVLGSAALLQFASKKLVFAENRKETIQQLTEFVETKIAPQELIDEIKQIGQALLPLSVTSKALPAPAEATPAPMPAVIEETVVKAEASPLSEPKVEVAATEETVLKAESTPVVEPKVDEATPEVNAASKAEVNTESSAGFKRSLSPYPYYPDFKPPSSPTPSRP